MEGSAASHAIALISCPSRPLAINPPDSVAIESWPRGARRSAFLAALVIGSVTPADVADVVVPHRDLARGTVEW